jgi:hypothetical protein
MLRDLAAKARQHRQTCDRLRTLLVSGHAEQVLAEARSDFFSQSVLTTEEKQKLALASENLCFDLIPDESSGMSSGILVSFDIFRLGLSIQAPLFRLDLTPPSVIGAFKATSRVLFDITQANGRVAAPIFDLYSMAWVFSADSGIMPDVVRNLRQAEVTFNIKGTDLLLAVAADHVTVLDLVSLNQSRIFRPELDPDWDDSDFLGGSSNATTLVVYFESPHLNHRPQSDFDDSDHDDEEDDLDDDCRPKHYSFVFMACPALQVSRKVVRKLSGKLEDAELLENGTLRLMVTCKRTLEPSQVAEHAQNGHVCEIWHLEPDDCLHLVFFTPKWIPPVFVMFLRESAVFQINSPSFSDWTQVRELDLEKRWFGPWLTKDTLQLVE